MYNKSVKMYQQRKLETLDPGALLTLCLERVGIMLKDCPPLWNEKRFERAQQCLDHIFEHITAMVHACEEGKRADNPLMISLSAYLLRMQVAVTQATVSKNVSQVLNIAQSFEKMAALLREKLKVPSPEASATGRPEEKTVQLSV